MQASEIINQIAVNDTLSVIYHKSAQDRSNPTNGQFRSFVNVKVTDIYEAKNGAIQIKVETPEGVRSFTSEAIVKALKINDLDIVKNYSLVE